MIYAARYDTMNALLGYLTENCCKGAAGDCASEPCAPIPTRKKAKERV
jgi:hypothetical protein